ncbi:MAG: hypothetical protein V1659_02365 [Candidatus Woesearchaeota archaeon]
MDKNFAEIARLLKKALPVLLKDPRIMAGCDISVEEIDDIINTKQISLKTLQNVAGDAFFTVYFDELNLEKEEGEKLNRFLYKTAPDFLEQLKAEISYLKE